MFCTKNSREFCHPLKKSFYISLFIIIIFSCLVPSIQAKSHKKPPKKDGAARESCPRSLGSQPMLYHKPTGKCYAMGTAGPCPNNLYLFAIPFGSIYGECDCPQPGDIVGDGNLFPNIYHKATDRCYPLYTKAFCPQNQWLTYKDNVTIQCEANPCADRVLQNMVHFEGKCVSLGSICGTGLYGLDKYVHLHVGNSQPSCDEAQSDASKLVINFKCGKGQVMDDQGGCQNVLSVV